MSDTVLFSSAVDAGDGPIWYNPMDALIEGGNVATSATIGAGSTGHLNITNTTVKLGAAAGIYQITVNLKGYREGGSSQTLEIHLIINGVRSAYYKSVAPPTINSYVTVVFTRQDFGQLGAPDIDNVNFGVAINGTSTSSCTFHVDAVSIEVVAGCGLFI